MSQNCHQTLKLKMAVTPNNLCKISNRKQTLGIYMLTLAPSSMISECSPEAVPAIKKHLSSYSRLKSTQKLALISSN